MIFPTPNLITDGDGFYVSYNRVDGFVYGGPTTALVWGQMQGFYILNGDHRREYAPLIPQGWDACYAYYLSRAEDRNDMGDKQFPPRTLAEIMAGKKEKA